jgi:hypothetical protein
MLYQEGTQAIHEILELGMEVVVGDVFPHVTPKMLDRV